jgi:DNA-binding response OmpR family regulator
MMTGKKHGNTSGQTGTVRRVQPDAPRRILVVEDETSIRRLNVERLRNAGYHADSAEDGAVAWEVMQLHSYDLLVTDNNMPKLTGMELLHKLYTAHISVPVIMATGILPKDKVVQHPGLQIQAILIKPYSIEELLAAVKNILVMYASNDVGGQRALPPNWGTQSSSDGSLLS